MIHIAMRGSMSDSEMLISVFTWVLCDLAMALAIVLLIVALLRKPKR